MMRRLDAWIGSRLFVPIIIWICQRAGITQHAFHRYAWLIAIAIVIYAGPKVEDAFDRTMFGLLLLLGFAKVISAALAPDRETKSSAGYRMLLVFIAALVGVLPAIVLAVGPDAQDGANLLILAAEYASTIKTIPPLSAAKRASGQTKLKGARPNYG